MADVTRWVLDSGGSYEYTFPRNPDRYGGDTYWQYQPRMEQIDIVGANSPNIQIDGFYAVRTLKWTAITGTMVRTLRDFYLRKQTIQNCKDHLYPTTPTFNCFITSFVSVYRPVLPSSFPGTGEDTYDCEMTLIKM